MSSSFARTAVCLGSYATMMTETAWICIRRPPEWSLIRDQMYDIGVTSLPVVAITGFSTGMVLAAQAIFQLSDYGISNVTGLMVSKSMIVELGPVLTAFMVTGRVGAAMCAELGTMQVTEQIDALRSMAIHPLRYLVAPRLIGGTAMMPILSLFSCVIGIVGGYLIAVGYYNMSSQDFLDPLPLHIKNFDLLLGFVKSFVFGIIIVTICCFRGMITTGGAKGVGYATTNSVVICYSVILIVNFFITLFMNSMHETLQSITGGWL